MATPGPDSGARPRTPLAYGDHAIPNIATATAPLGPDAFVAKMLQSINEESRNEAERGGQKCKMALMSHHSLDKLWTQKHASGMNRKDYTMQALERGLANFYPAAQVSELIKRTPRGMGTTHHYTASVGWGPVAEATTANMLSRSATTPQAASQRRRPSSAPPGGRPPLERSGMPSDLLSMGFKLSEAERALSEVRAGLTSHMAAASGGAQPSSTRHREAEVVFRRPVCATAPGRTSASDLCQTATPGRIRPSSAPGSRYKDVQREAAVNAKINGSAESHVPLNDPRKNVRSRQRSRQKRPTSAPAHSAARANARAQARRQPKAGERAKTAEKVVNPALMSKIAQIATASQLNRRDSQRFAEKPLPSSYISGQDFWSHSSAQGGRKPRKHPKGKSLSKSTGNLGSRSGHSPPLSAQSNGTQLPFPAC